MIINQPNDRGDCPPATREEAVKRLRAVLGRISPMEDKIINALWDGGSPCEQCGRTIVPQ